MGHFALDLGARTVTGTVTGRTSRGWGGGFLKEEEVVVVVGG